MTKQTELPENLRKFNLPQWKIDCLRYLFRSR